MGWLILILTILFSSCFTIAFKFYQRHGIQTGFAIVINYLVASSIAFAFSCSVPNFTSFLNYKWFWAAIAIGFLFITLFNLLAITSQKIGITQANIANKTTFIFPALMGILFFNETINLFKILGVVFAIFSVYKSAKEKSERASAKHSNLLIIMALFIGGGCLDVLLSFTNEALLPVEEVSLFTAYSFLFAGIFGTFHLVFSKTIFQKNIFSLKNTVGGLILGTVNYFSIFTFLTALSFPYLDSSVVFTSVNMGIIVISSFLSKIIFQEIISKNKLHAIILAVCSILLVSFSALFPF